MIGFALTPEHKMVREMVRDFAAKEVAPYIRENDEQSRFDRSLPGKMGALGMLGGPIPEQYGGAGLDYLSFGITCEELEYVDTTARTIVSVHVGLNSLTLFTWGSEEQKQRWLVPQARGEKLACFGLTEPAAGSDVAGMQSTARRDGDSYVLNGEKIWISLADDADHFLFFAYTDKEKKYRGITAFVVERSTPGLTTAPIHGKMGLHAGSTGSFSLMDARVPLANRLGEEGEGFTIAMSTLDNGRYGVASGAVGLIRACLDASVRYAQTRTAFGIPIGQHQLVKAMIAEMVASRDAAELLCLRSGWMKNQGIPNTRETALAKWFATEAAERAAHNAIQIHGSYGYSNEYPVERFYRNARVGTIYEGTSQIHQLLQADYALGYRQTKAPRCTLPPYGRESR